MSAPENEEVIDATVSIWDGERYHNATVTALEAEVARLRELAGKFLLLWYNNERYLTGEKAHDPGEQTQRLNRQLAAYQAELRQGQEE